MRVLMRASGNSGPRSVWQALGAFSARSTREHAPLQVGEGFYLHLRVKMFTGGLSHFQLRATACAPLPNNA